MSTKLTSHPFRVLVCPLDWGLGHATRCIPVIRELRSQGAEVLIASSGAALDLLRKEFPGLISIELPGYGPRYHRMGSLALKMIMQLPRFVSAMQQEHRLIQTIVKKHSIGLIISDNRYGCYSPGAISIFLTHQIRVLPLPGLRGLSRMANWLLRLRIDKFDEVWIPDQPGDGLAMAFAGPTKGPQHFVGWMSRFTSVRSVPRRYGILGIVSGPEPQRKIFFDLLLSELKKQSLISLLVAGEPGLSYHRKEGNVEVVSHLTADLLEEAMAAADVIVARSGYSTIMDLIAMQKKAILIPTPQQTEQLSLARILSEKGIVPMADQHEPDFKRWLQNMEQYKGFSGIEMNRQLLRENVARILNAVR